jgi:hypothetical protein
MLFLLKYLSDYLLTFFQLKLLPYLFEIDALTIHSHAFFGLRLILRFNRCLSLLDHCPQFFIEIVLATAAFSEDLLYVLLFPQSDAR